MLFSWLKRRRRKKLVAAPLPEASLGILASNVPQYQSLSADERTRFVADLKIFLGEKYWEGCGGLQLTDEMRVTIAAYACLMTVGLGVEVFDHVLSILVYPSAFVVPHRHALGETSLVGEMAVLGEAHHRGPVILSWDEVLRDARQPGSGGNLVWHEMAHQLDMLDRAFDGVPPLARREDMGKWREVVTAEYDRLVADTETGRPTLLDEYGASDLVEFFAVATECFFDRPGALRTRHRDLYQLLAGFYRQDPAARTDGPAKS